jgi:hypothetical protein
MAEYLPKIFIAATGQGQPVKAVVNGQPVTLEANGSVFLSLDGTPRHITVEFLLGDATPGGVPKIHAKTIIPPVTDKAFWNPGVNPASTNVATSAAFDFTAAGVFLGALEKAGLGDSFEAGQARVVVQMLTAAHERRRLIAAGRLRVPQLEGIPPADAAAVDKLYATQARIMLGGLQDHLKGISLWRHPVKPEVLRLAKESGLLPLNP